MKNRKTIGITVVAVLILLVGWRFYQIFSGGASRPSGRGGGTSRKVVVDEVGKGRLVLDYELVGDVESSQTVDIVARTNGLLEEVAFLEGDEVEKGDLLAKIDDSQAQANYFKVKGDLANAQFTYYQLQSQRELTDVQANSGVLIAQADLEAAKAGVAKNQAVYRATLSQGKTTVAQAQASLEEAKANQRQAEVDFSLAKVKYERILGLKRQGFVSQADVQDAYAEVLSQNAAVDARKAQVKAVQTQLDNAREQLRRDQASAKADILTSQAQRTSASATLNEAEAGTSRSRSFEQQLLAQRSLVEAAEAEVRSAELQLEDTTLRSPIDGSVSNRAIDPGTVVNVGDVILTLQSGDEVWVVAALPQEIYQYVEKGASCKVRVDGLRDQTFEAYIYQKDSTINPSSRQFNIRVKIDDPEKVVKPGMFARVLLTLGPDGERLLVPSAALRDRDDEARRASVLVVKNGKVEERDVVLGPSDGEVSLVRNGLMEGEQVVIQSAFSLKDGQEVEAQMVEPSPSDVSPTPTAPGTR